MQPAPHCLVHGMQSWFVIAGEKQLEAGLEVKEIAAHVPCRNFLAAGQCRDTGFGPSTVFLGLDSRDKARACGPLGAGKRVGVIAVRHGVKKNPPREQGLMHLCPKLHPLQLLHRPQYPPPHRMPVQVARLYPALARIDRPLVHQPVLGDLQNLPK